MSDPTLDYYLYNADVSSVKVAKFKALYDLQKNAAEPNYDLSVLSVLPPSLPPSPPTFLLQPFRAKK